MDYRNEYEDFLVNYRFEINKILEKIDKGNISRPEFANLRIRALNAKMNVLKELAQTVKSECKCATKKKAVPVDNSSESTENA